MTHEGRPLNVPKFPAKGKNETFNGRPQEAKGAYNAGTLGCI